MDLSVPGSARKVDLAVPVPVLYMLALLLPLQPQCGSEPDTLAAAATKAEVLDLAAALAMLEGRPALRGCAEIKTGILYLRGLEAARDAYGQGGAETALAPVRAAIERLSILAGGRPGPAEIGRLTLSAAAAAAQSERDEMAAFLLQATAIESLQLAAGQPGAPALSALEVAGDLWLRVHRYADARRAYEEAAGYVGLTPHVMAGLARVAVRQQDQDSACRQFVALLDWWGAREERPSEIEEAHDYVDRFACVEQ